MTISISDQAYGFAAVSGLPLGKPDTWCELVAELAKSAKVQEISSPDALNALASAAEERASNLAAGDKRVGYELTQDWLLEHARRTDVPWEMLQLTDGDLVTSFNAAREVLDDLGIEVPASTHFEVVDEFPEPFHTRTWNAFCPDPVDEERFGIPAGIYLRKSRLRPVRSQTLVSHELCHVLPGLSGGEYLAMGLEEGIAEIVGNIIIGGRILPPAFADNDFAFTLLGVKPSPSPAYLEHTRQAYTIYERSGLAGLVQLLQEGRAAIRRAEVALLNGEPLTTPDSPPTGQEARRVARLVLSSLSGLILSPLHYKVARVVASGMSVGDVAREASVDKSMASDVLDELSDTTGMVVMSKQVVEFSNFELYRDASIGLTPLGLRVAF
jgi:hypothetical protein